MPPKGFHKYVFAPLALTVALAPMQIAVGETLALMVGKA
jgi:hypothetical protein